MLCKYRVMPGSYHHRVVKEPPKATAYFLYTSNLCRQFGFTFRHRRFMAWTISLSFVTSNIFWP